MPGRKTKKPVSQKQARAFFAAASGKSKIGIPKKVGKEKVAAIKRRHTKIGKLPKRAKKK